MGMYTELVCALELRENTPSEILDVIRYMLDETDELERTPDHKLFKTSRWEFMLRSDSYYFDGTSHSFLKQDNLTPDRPMYFLNIRCNLKNYDNEIDKFIDWISLYAETTGFIGYKRYEEDEEPTLIYI